MAQSSKNKNLDVDLILKQIEEEGRTFQAVADEFGISTGTISYHLKKKRAEEQEKLASMSELTAFEEWGQWEEEKPDWREIVLHAREGADLMQRHEPKYDFVKRKIKTDNPIALVFISDLHLGASSTDYDAFLETADFLSDKNIRVNAVSPGGILSNLPERFLENYSKKVPLGRMANNDDIKGVVVFLASQASAYINGENILMDGGMHA